MKKIIALSVLAWIAVPQAFASFTCTAQCWETSASSDAWSRGRLDGYTTLSASGSDQYAIVQRLMEKCRVNTRTGILTASASFNRSGATVVERETAGEIARESCVENLE